MAAAQASRAGFAFEELVGKTLTALMPPMKAKGFKVKLLTEQDIRDVFGEQSLNGVDHLLEIEDASGAVTLFLFQEKWKLLTNQREVSQFLDCCARILSRIPAVRRSRVYRLWVTRSAPSANGEKSLLEGGAYTVQCMTSPAILAQITAQMVCELLGDRALAVPAIAGMPSLLPEESPLDPKVLDESKISVAMPVGKMKVVVQKGDYFLGAS
jgi:hypothetical protein